MTEEPNTVRWQDLNEKMKERLRQQLLTTIATLAAIVSIAFVIQLLNNQSVTFSAFGISIFNAIFPYFAKFLTSMEVLKSEGNKQRSMYGKIAFFRWANTAIVSRCCFVFKFVKHMAFDCHSLTKEWMYPSH